MRISRPVRSHFSPLPQTEEDGNSSGKMAAIGSSVDQTNGGKDGEGGRKKACSENIRGSFSISEPLADGDRNERKKSNDEKINETNNTTSNVIDQNLDNKPEKQKCLKVEESSSSKDVTDQESKHGASERHRTVGSNTKQYRDSPRLLSSMSSPSGGRRGSGGTTDAGDCSSFLSILNSSSFKMKRKSFGTESEKRRGERFQREREMAYGAMGISLDNHYEDDGDDDDDDDCDDDEDESDDDGEDDDDTSSEASTHVCDFSCPLIIHGQCPNATKKSRASRRRLRGTLSW